MFEKKRLDFGCALWGDNDINLSNGNKYDLALFFEYLICYKGVTRFYFTNFKQFNKMCWEIISNLKVRYTQVKRIWIVRDYGINVFTDDYPAGYGFMDFDDKQHIKVTNPQSSIEENICVCKSILQLALFHVFCFDSDKQIKEVTFNSIAYNLCVEEGKKKILFNLYVPKDLRKYQPDIG